MISEYIAVVVKAGLKAYRYFRPLPPEPSAVLVWTSICTHWVGVLAGPVILALIFKRTCDIIRIRCALNAGGDPAKKPKPAGGEAGAEGQVPAEQAIEPTAAEGAARQDGGDGEQQEVKAEERPDLEDAPAEEAASGDA
ncbi:uncharacterized protein LOC108151189 [Drosophila miranda]|uniref:uncharacterized protein LOC108151189 n=1 Tax=Drosophila miranda TaxID=7229 RepID=UPI0007E825F6|nr:uncharacterized protein LOC108151189 [Drosophila miranda]XP_033242865.1 uncharacterized protein LOC108151189 [Drosophila miranda]XP_033242866.1 uncharacterized protein LOC108151189 [Drosophila miranda]